MIRLKTNGNFISKITRKQFEQSEVLNMKFNKNGQLSTSKNNANKIVSLSQFRNKFKEKYNLKIKAKRSKGIDETKKYEKEIYKPPKTNNLIKRQKNKAKKINSSNNLNKNLIKNNLMKENTLKKNNKQEYNECSPKTVVNKNEEKDINKDYNGGEKIITKLTEKEKNLIISKIIKNKRMNYYENTNSQERINIRINNKDKTFTERNSKRIKNEMQIMNYCSFNKINEIHFDYKLKFKHMNKNIENRKDNTFEYPENGGINTFNKTFDIDKSQKKNDLKKYINNQKNENISTDNKKLNKVNYDSYMNTFDKKERNINLSISPMPTSKNDFNKTKIYNKKIKLTLSQNILFTNHQQDKYAILTNNSSRSKITYNERLQQKKKLLGIHLKSKEYKMIKKKMEDDLTTRNIKKNYVFAYKRNQLENNTVRIYDKEKNSIKMMRKRSRISHKYKRNLEFQYDNELYKKSQDKIETINYEKIRNMHKIIGFYIIPKGLELMRKLTEM